MSFTGARFVWTLFKLENRSENSSLFVCALQRRIVSDEMLFCTWKLFDIVFVSFQPPLLGYGCLKMVNRTRAEGLPLWDLTWLMWVAIACWLCWNCAWDWFGVVLTVLRTPTLLLLAITVKPGKVYPPRFRINESVMWKMNPLVVAATSIKFKFTFVHSYLAVNFYDNFFVFIKIEKSLNGYTCLKSFTSNSRKLTW